MSTQAKQIRDVILALLNDPVNLEPISNSPSEINIRGIRYKDIQKMLTNTQRFSPGAITGTLNTISERMPIIRKLKTEKGTFFVKHSKLVDVIEKKVDSPYDLDDEVRILRRNINKNIDHVQRILTLSKMHKDSTESDIEYLKIILKYLYDITELTRTYEQNKYLQ